MDGHELNKVIAFRKGFAPDDEHGISKSQLQKLIKALLAKETYMPVHSYYESLSPAQIEMIISNLMYTKGASEINLTINKEKDGYHLGLTIHSVDDKNGKDKDSEMY